VPPHANGGNPPQVKSVEVVVDDVEVDVSELLLDEEDEVELVVVSSTVDELDELELVLEEVDVDSSVVDDVDVEVVVVDSAVDELTELVVVEVVETVTVCGQAAGAGASSAPKRPGSS